MLRLYEAKSKPKNDNILTIKKFIKRTIFFRFYYINKQQYLTLYLMPFLKRYVFILKACDVRILTPQIIYISSIGASDLWHYTLKYF